MLGHWIPPIDDAPAVRSCKQQRHRVQSCMLSGKGQEMIMQSSIPRHWAARVHQLLAQLPPRSARQPLISAKVLALRCMAAFLNVPKPTCCLKGPCKGSIAHSRGPQDIAGDLHVCTRVCAVHLDVIGSQLGQGTSQAVPCSHSQEQQWGAVHATQDIALGVAV